VYVGFIDFIVDPCFQVMGDMLESILRPLQENKDESTQSHAATATVNHASRSSSLSSQSSARSTPSPIRTRKRKLWPTSALTNAMFVPQVYRLVGLSRSIGHRHCTLTAVPMLNV